MATKQQIPVLAGSIVSNQGAFEPLSTDDAQWVIEHPEEAIKLWVEATTNRNKTWTTPLIQKRVLTPSRTITYGGITKSDLVQKVAKEQNLGDWAKDLMGKPAFTTAETKGSTDLVFLTLGADLGFTKNPRTDEFMTAQFCAAWSPQYLDGQVIEPCQPEDGPHLRLQYDDQPNGEVIWMAMERITGSDGNPGVFRVKRRDGGGRWLYANRADPDSQWHLDDRVGFRLRKVTES
jgi:hypothetical protein